MRLFHAIAFVLCFSIALNELKAKEDLKDLSARVLKSVGTVLVENNGKFVPNGSGFFISEDGQFVTNHHVVEGHKKIKIEKVEGGQYTVSGILYSQPNRDLAVLKVKGTGFVPLKLSEKITIGESIAVVGSPQGLGGSVTNGIVSAKRNFGDMKLDLNYANDTQCIQITAPISPGSSGSAIVSIDSGKVIAIASFNRKGGQALNFGISSEHINQLLVSKNKIDVPLKNKIPNRLAWPSDEEFTKFDILTDQASDQNNLRNFRKALSLATQANEIAAKSVGKNHPDYLDNKMSLAFYFINNNQFDLASSHLKGVIKTLDQGAYNHEIFERYYEISAYYYYQGDNTLKAVESYRKALDINVNHTNDIEAQIAILGRLGACYTILKNFKSATGSYETLFALVKTENIPEKRLFREFNHGMSYMVYAEALYNLKNYNDAIYNFKKAGQLFRKYDGEISEQLAQIANRLGFCYRELGDSANELKFFNLEDSIDRKLKPD